MINLPELLRKIADLFHRGTNIGKHKRPTMHKDSCEHFEDHYLTIFTVYTDKSILLALGYQLI